MRNHHDHYVRTAFESLEKDGAQDIVVISLDEKNAIADAMMIASGSSCRHVSALADNLVRRLKKAKLGKPVCEGLETCEWVLVDAGSLIAHLFLPEIRRFYDLESLWDWSPQDE